jgi:hypothetical protein
LGIYYYYYYYYYYLLAYINLIYYKLKLI